MSPDDAEPTIGQPISEMPTLDEEVKPKKSFKERFSSIGKGMEKGGDSLGKVPGIKRVPKSMRVFVVVLIVVLVVLAGVAIAFSLGGDEDTGPKPPKVLNVDALDDWSWSSGPIDGQMSEFSDTTMAMEDLEGFPTNGTIFISSITMMLEWQDEPDDRWAGRTRYNEADYFAVEVNSSLGVGAASELTGNDESSKQGSVSVTMNVEGDTSFAYLLLGNVTDLRLPDTIASASVDLIIHMDEAGDLYASGPAMFKLNDFGNAYTLTVTCTGKILPE